MNNLVNIEVSMEYAPKVYLYKRKTGWYWKFLLPNGRWFYGKAPGNDEQILKRNKALKEIELSKGLFTQKEFDKYQQYSNKVTPFSSAIQDYIEHLKTENASPNYYLDFNTSLKNMAKYFEQTRGVKYIHKVTDEDAYNFRKFLLKRVKLEEIKKVTASRSLNNGSTFF